MYIRSTKIAICSNRAVTHNTAWCKPCCAGYESTT